MPTEQAAGRSYRGAPRDAQYLAENFVGMAAADIRVLLAGVKGRDVRSEELRAGLARALEIREWMES